MKNEQKIHHHYLHFFVCLGSSDRDICKTKPSGQFFLFVPCTRSSKPFWSAAPLRVRLTKHAANVGYVKGRKCKKSQ